MAIKLRPARPEDFPYCAALYFAEAARLDPARRDSPDFEADFERRWLPAQVRIIERDRRELGWLQTERTPDGLFLAQIFVDEACRGQGVGSAALRLVIGEVDRQGLAMTLGVVKANPARALYERLGFAIIGEDGRKFHMRRPGP